MKVHRVIWGLHVCVLRRNNGFRGGRKISFPPGVFGYHPEGHLALGLLSPGRTTEMPFPHRRVFLPCGLRMGEPLRPRLPPKRSRTATAVATVNPPSVRTPGQRARPLPPVARSRARCAGSGTEAPTDSARPGGAALFLKLAEVSRVWSFATLFTEMSERKMTSER